MASHQGDGWLGGQTRLPLGLFTVLVVTSDILGLPAGVHRSRLLDFQLANE
jgi:hypothetical protein